MRNETNNRSKQNTTTRRRVIVDTDSEEEQNGKLESDSESDDISKKKSTRRLRNNPIVDGESDLESDSKDRSDKSDYSETDSDSFVVDDACEKSDLESGNPKPVRKSSRLKKRSLQKKHEKTDSESESELSGEISSIIPRRSERKKKTRNFNEQSDSDENLETGKTTAERKSDFKVVSNTEKRRTRNSTRLTVDNSINSKKNRESSHVDDAEVRKSTRLKKHVVNYNELDSGHLVSSGENVHDVCDDTGKEKPASRLPNRQQKRLRRISLKETSSSSSSSEDEHVQMVTPVKTKPTAEATSTSSVRRSGRKRRASFTLPDRRSALDGIETTPVKQNEIDYFRRQKSNNRSNLIKCASEYNQETRSDYYNDYYSSDDDFIDDNLDNDVYDVRNKKKKRKEKTKKRNRFESDDGSPSEASVKEVDEETGIDSDAQIEDDKTDVLKEAINTRRATLKENNETSRQLEKLQKLRATKGMSLKERQNVLESDSETEGDSALNHPYEEHQSDREFIDDDDSSECEADASNEQNKENVGGISAGVNGNGVTTRVIMNDSSEDDDEHAMEISLGEDELLFFKSVSINDLETCRRILTTHSFVNILNKEKDTALHAATKLAHAQMVELLLEFGAKANMGNAEHQAPAICYAAWNKDPACFAVLLAETDLAMCNENIFRHIDGKNILHLLVEEPPAAELNNKIFETCKISQCIDMLRKHDEYLFRKYVSELDNDNSTPLVAAIKSGCFQGVRSLAQTLLEYKSEGVFGYETDQGGNLLHLAVQYSALTLQEVLPYVSNQLNNRDINGWTPLMYSCELSRFDCFRLLHQAGASIYVIEEKKGITPLHLAAASGNLDIIKYLLRVGHSIDCQDENGWPPLLYANFQTEKQCVVELFKKNPGQLFCLGHLISREHDNEVKEKNAKIIQKTLESISHIDTYYTLFNNFISQNLSLLDINKDQGVFIRAWKRILSFENKMKWLKKKYSFNEWNITRVLVNREKVLESAMNQLIKTFPIDFLNVKFIGEEGICLGPKREFLSCMVRDITDTKHKIFVSADKKNYSPSPNSFFLKKMKTRLLLNNGGPSATVKKEDIGETIVEDHDCSINDDDFVFGLETQEQKEYEEKQQLILRQLRFVGRFVAQVVLSKSDIELQLTKSFVQQILGEKLTHPDILSQEDNTYYNTIKNNNMDDLYLPFSTNCLNPWSNSLEEISLSSLKDVDISEDNKDEYLKNLSLLLYEQVISDETKAFKSGFHEIIYKYDMEMFTADEFSLLLNGVRKIDINDWKQNTRYEGYTKTDEVIIWFWLLVESLKEEERSLLLKFVTGTPCVPIGGFANLLGFGGGYTRFNICRSHRQSCDQLPGASTCFNRLNIPKYTSEEMLRDKLLIAIRHGSEGFAFM